MSGYDSGGFLVSMIQQLNESMAHHLPSNAPVTDPSWLKLPFLITLIALECTAIVWMIRRERQGK